MTATTSELVPAENVLLKFQYEYDGGNSGSMLTSGDYDGDGSQDLVIGAYSFDLSGVGTDLSGKVYLYMSNDYGW